MKPIAAALSSKNSLSGILDLFSELLSQVRLDSDKSKFKLKGASVDIPPKGTLICSFKELNHLSQLTKAVVLQPSQLNNLLRKSIV